MVVDHVVKGMFAVTFEIGVELFQSTLGVVIIRGKNGGGSRTRRFEVAEALRKEKMYSRCIQGIFHIINGRKFLAQADLGIEELLSIAPRFYSSKGSNCYVPHSFGLLLFSSSACYALVLTRSKWREWPLVWH